MMTNLYSSVRDLAAALLVALLPIVVFAGAANAQVISNTADASWTRNGSNFSNESNTVEFRLVENRPTIITYIPQPGSGTSVSVRAPMCGNAPIAGIGADASGNLNTSITQTSLISPGNVLYFKLNAPVANLNSSRIDSVLARIVSSTGDEETLEVFETGPNTGEFVGAIPTIGTPPAFVKSDCRLSVVDAGKITITTRLPNADPIIATIELDVLADPFGFVFDSEDGTPISGALVTLVDALTGAPAQVFAEDGVTPWPSTVTSGGTVTDGAGNIYSLQPGEFRFPLAALGDYRLVVQPPAPYTSPSAKTPDELARLTRPNGSPFIITDASYGGAFRLESIIPVRIDIPLDRPNIAVTITKSVSKPRALPGDAVFYTVTIRNQDQDRPKRGITVVDTPSEWLRFRPDSIRIDGQERNDLVRISPNGRRLNVDLGDVAPGATQIIRYAMVVRADAPPGQALNEAVATDPSGNAATASAPLRIERDTIAGRMTLIGRVSEGPCTLEKPRRGIPGVRVMLEDGSFAITDIDGRYHFEGLVPGTHVVAVHRQTLPEGGEFIDCTRSTRSAGSPISRFVIGQGGSLAVADFHAILPEGVEFAQETTLETIQSSSEAAGAETDWLALGDGPIDWLFPAIDHNPRAPAVRVAIRHRAGQKVSLNVDGKPVDPLAFDGMQTSADGKYAVSLWRAVHLTGDTTRLSATVTDKDGSVAAQLERVVNFTSTPARVELIEDASQLIADGRTRPVVAIRVLDRNGRPVRQGVSGQFTVNSPYESAQALDSRQLAQLTGIGSTSPAWKIEGDNGIALIELAPTLVSGALKLDFTFADGELTRKQKIDSWIEPGDQEWTLVGLAEGTVGARSVADNMERTGSFDSDLGDDARVAFYAKGRVLGKFLLTVAYDSAKQEADQRLLGAIDPNAYYTVFGDGSSRRFDAASREKLYVRVESSTFYALYGDFETGFDQTTLARYQRIATGAKAEARFGAVTAQAFATEITTRYRRDEIQGAGLSGPYSLSDRAIIANSETVAIETRDRFRSEVIVERRELSRFLDYNIDLLSGTITFKEPITSRDFDLNPQFIVIDYEVEALGASGELNAGFRAAYTTEDDSLRVGATVLTDKGEGERTNIAALDAKLRVGNSTEVRAEIAMSRREGENAKAWLVEAEHRGKNLDVIGYVRSTDADYGVGQLNSVEQGRRKIGFDGRYRVSEALSVVGSAWYDDSLTDDSNRRAVQLQGVYRSKSTDLRLGIAHFDDRLSDGTSAKSTVLEGGVTQRLFDNRLELSATSSIAIEGPESIDLPARHRFTARYELSQAVRLIGSYEIAEGDNLDARTLRGGIEVTPWNGAKLVTTLGQQDIDEFGNRSFAAYGLSQTFAVTPNLTIDATIDGNKSLGGTDIGQIINVDQPIASGGHLGQDGSLFEDFTAVTLGASWRKDRWTATGRAEYRDGEFANRKGVTFGAIRQLGEGSIVGSGFTWTKADGVAGTETEIFNGAISAAHRPDESPFAFLAKIEYRSDVVSNAVFGEAGPAGRTALAITGDGASKRLIGSLSTNWSPRDEDDDTGEFFRRTEIGVFLAARYNFDRFEGFDLDGFTGMAGLDARIGISDKIDIGAAATVRANLTDDTTSFSIGPQIGFAPTDNMLLTVGYNVTGFRDRDFSAARNTDKGIYASVRLKFDSDSLSFLGLGR